MTEQTPGVDAAAPDAAARGGRWPWVFAALLLVLLGLGVAPRLERSRALDRREAEARLPPLVATARVTRSEPKAELTLPGTVLPSQRASLHARINGFVGRIHVDLGDRVRAGQLLAELEAPELQAECHRARARLDETERNLELARASARRGQILAGEGNVSHEVAEEARARANSAEASLKSAKAEVERLEALYAFRRVVAPFDGVIVRRNVDRGALVTAGSGSGMTSLFELAQTHTLKVYVDVPQSLAHDIRPGLEARIFTLDAPARALPGRVVRTAGVLDPGTRTLLTEVQLANTEALFAGSFVRVRLLIEREAPPMLIPASALAVRREGPTVLVVGEANAVQQRVVVLGRDLGAHVEVMDGLSAEDRVVLSPPDTLGDGRVVRVAEGRAAR
ncbi:MULTISPECIES: efflux RND transporter periplasmic adaptor subunit [Myxococcus]|uniref:efflux RND transporter periplasmic adaptor subunit n=1 Tax=Myxococcus TaxID=32 RepID=UPI0002E4618C|nr:MULTISPECIES: efflux RND transporter periplasmic adaptor subunit [Myxococcus]NOJ52879.1 efflux RND transporter periplasmic adaptor subunit [Myxococcus xanthus]QPM76547.1 efflux RND transporter periplasmic adaptor subunit [Myxococcus xanthus]QVW65610.1 efflux RND transporter periplasmic adaptor subunit [Myxococcus xanthus DZ2]QZZ51611.1 Multidrug resistance protein MdtA [Myxococcus xanthus]UEO08260.1 efflux RND transporter periplasmic adaptor subunit [Myxococcus xanthus DZ2]